MCTRAHAHMCKIKLVPLVSCYVALEEIKNDFFLPFDKCMVEHMTYDPMDGDLVREFVLVHNMYSMHCQCSPVALHICVYEYLTHLLCNCTKWKEMHCTRIYVLLCAEYVYVYVTCCTLYEKSNQKIYKHRCERVAKDEVSL